MTATHAAPELLAPAGSLDSVRAALANGADAVYLGAGRFNARDDGAQLSLDELGIACRLAHQRSSRIYLTLNTLVKPGELVDALEFLGRAVDLGIDAVIVQDLGLVTLIRQIFPELEIHGSTQMTVHDPSGAAVLRGLGVKRVVLARENTLDDIRHIGRETPGIGLESFIHGALCISYSGQCFMSGMISERSANRGSCAQSCRKGYQLLDVDSQEVLDDGFLISARDLAAAEHLDSIAAAGVSCLKIEGRKKRPEYVATVTGAYRRMLDQMRAGEAVHISEAEMIPLVQIFSRGFTKGMYGGRDGRHYVTRTHPDNLGVVLGSVVEQRQDGIVIEVDTEVFPGDGLGFDSPSVDAPSRGFRVTSVRKVEDVGRGNGGAPRMRQLVHTRETVPVGCRVVRSSQAALMDKARASYDVVEQPLSRRNRVDVTVSGRSGTPLRAAFAAAGDTVFVESTILLAPARQREIDAALLREQLGRMGGTPFALASIDLTGLEDGLFIPVSELNHLRQRAVDDLLGLRDAGQASAAAAQHSRIEAAVSNVPDTRPRRDGGERRDFELTAEVYNTNDARTAARAGATEIVLDPFLRHPAPPLSRVQSLASELKDQGIGFRLRTPTIIRPQDRNALTKWLALDTPIETGHLGLMAEECRMGRDVVADYATNCFNEHTASVIFQQGASAVVLSVELTSDEIAEVVRPWGGIGFVAVAYGRPEGMTMEHCVLSAAFDRVPTTCRDLCVQKHPNVTLTDPTGYSFPLATDSDCRNRLLHSRPIEASTFMPRLWAGGIRGYKLIFNVPHLPVEGLVHAYRRLLDALHSGGTPPSHGPHELLSGEFTRGHYARAV